MVCVLVLYVYVSGSLESEIRMRMWIINFTRGVNNFKNVATHTAFQELQFVIWDGEALTCGIGDYIK